MWTHITILGWLHFDLDNAGHCLDMRNCLQKFHAKVFIHNFFLIIILHVFLQNIFIGYQPKGIEVQSFERINIDSRRTYKDFDASVLQGKTVYSTLQCQNKAGLISSLSSDGVTIYDQPPSMASAVIRTLPLSLTEYPALDYYQSVTNNLKIVWSGVEDKIGVQQYKAS